MTHIPAQSPHRRRASFPLLLTALIASILAFSGCSSSDSNDFNPAWKLDEHGNPDFKPDDFEEAAETLKSRFDDIATLAEADRVDLIRQFLQILRWMPEYAADTPIGREGWEKLATLCARLETASRDGAFFAADRAGTFRQDLAEIVALVPPDPLYQRLKGGVGHDHDDDHEKHDDDRSPTTPADAPIDETHKTEERGEKS